MINVGFKRRIWSGFHLTYLVLITVFYCLKKGNWGEENMSFSVVLLWIKYISPLSTRLSFTLLITGVYWVPFALEGLGRLWWQSNVPLNNRDRFSKIFWGWLGIFGWIVFSWKRNSLQNCSFCQENRFLHDGRFYQLNVRVVLAWVFSNTIPVFPFWVWKTRKHFLSYQFSSY